MAADRRFFCTVLRCPQKTRNVCYSIKFNLNSIRCFWSSFPVKDPKFSKHFSSKEQNVYDVAIVGGGAIGSSSAYFLASRMHGQGKICVIECDPTYSKASTTLSVGSVRQQFSMAENIKMSQYGFQFLSEIEQHLAVDGCDPPDIQLHSQGYLFLASKEGEEKMKENHATQRELGCEVVLLSPSELSERFPWLNTDGISLASLGIGREGWFDPWSLLNAYKRKASSLNVDYITGEAVDFITDHNGQICSIKVCGECCRCKGRVSRKEAWDISACGTKKTLCLCTKLSWRSKQTSNAVNY